MALTKCPDCGTDVSDIAPTCPKCGRPLAAEAAAVASEKATEVAVKRVIKYGLREIIIIGVCILGLWLIVRDVTRLLPTGRSSLLDTDESCIDAIKNGGFPAAPDNTVGELVDSVVAVKGSVQWDVKKEKGQPNHLRRVLVIITKPDAIAPGVAGVICIGFILNTKTGAFEADYATLNGKAAPPSVIIEALAKGIYPTWR